MFLQDAGTLLNRAPYFTEPLALLWDGHFSEIKWLRYCSLCVNRVRHPTLTASGLPPTADITHRDYHFRQVRNVATKRIVRTQICASSRWPINDQPIGGSV